MDGDNGGAGAVGTLVVVAGAVDVALVEVARVRHLLPLLVAAGAAEDLPVAHIAGLGLLTVCCWGDAWLGEGDVGCSRVLVSGQTRRSLVSR